MVLPTRFAWYPEFVPEELKCGRVWVCCDREKVPLIAGPRYRRASSTDPGTWRTYGQAVGALEATLQRFAGVGRVIQHHDPYVGVDLDDVRDPASRDITPWARNVLEGLNSYTEVSPSGRGVKVWIRGGLGRSYVKPDLEIYVGGRYFTTTGQVLVQYPETIEARQEELEELIGREFPRSRRRTSGAGGRPYDGPPRELGEFFTGVEVFTEVRDSLGIKFAVVCPWVEEHTGADESGTYVGQLETGACWFKCWHSHCVDKGWPEFRTHSERARKVLARIRKGSYVA
jgi:hypothetical protein